ncbi:MAG: GYF domain-containing protein [Opitutaceae bacterium]|jgi:hypothetical protein
MYTIIGGDGKEYGPVTAEQIRSWIAAGRANLETKVKAAGTDQWRTVVEFPELTGAAPAGAGAPVSGAVLSGAAQKLNIIGCYERSWALLKANFWPFLGLGVIMAVIFTAFGYTQYSGLFFVTPLLWGVFAAGFYNFFLRRIRGQPATIGDAFAGFSGAFGRLAVAGIVISVFSTVGLICLIVPGIYLIIAYTFTYILSLDKGLGFWEAMETSRKVITRQWWRVLGVILLGIPFLLLGFAAFGVGIFIALPLVIAAFAYAYEDLCNPRG